MSPSQLSLIAIVPAALLPSFSAIPVPEMVPVQLRPLSTYFASNSRESPTVFPVTSASTGDGDVNVNFPENPPFAPAVVFAVPVYAFSATLNSTL